jgi:hypothetical protein
LEPNSESESRMTTEQALVHGLRWGIKSSFVDYVRKMPDGKGSVGDGAVPVGTGDIFYTYDAEASTDEAWAFRGDVRFSGHFGMLFVRLAHPRLELGADGAAVLTIEGAESERIALVTATVRRVGGQDGTDLWGSDDVALTTAGVELFNEVYAEGEPFEPIVIQLPARD